MKRVSVMSAIVLLVVHIAHAQLNSSNLRFTGAQSEPGTASALSEDMAEMKRLNAKLLKLYREGKYEEAIPVAEQILEITEKTQGVDQDNIARSLLNLGELHQAINNYTKAEPLYKRAVEIWDKKQRPMNAEIALTLGRYACLMRKNKRPDEAEQLELRAYGILIGGAGEKTQSIAMPPLKKITNGKVISLPQPRHQGIAGTVIVRFLTDESGKVILACAVSGNPKLAQGAEQAAYRAQFTPTLVDDKPIKVTGEVSYNFR